MIKLDNSQPLVKCYAEGTAFSQINSIRKYCNYQKRNAQVTKKTHTHTHTTSRFHRQLSSDENQQKSVQSSPSTSRQRQESLLFAALQYFA